MHWGLARFGKCEVGTFYEALRGPVDIGFS